MGGRWKLAVSVGVGFEEEGTTRPPLLPIALVLAGDVDRSGGVCVARSAEMRSGRAPYRAAFAGGLSPRDSAKRCRLRDEAAHGFPERSRHPIAPARWAGCFVCSPCRSIARAALEIFPGGEGLRRRLLKSWAESTATSSEKSSMKSWAGEYPEMARTRQAWEILADIFRSRLMPAPGSVRCACREDWPGEEMPWRAGRFLPARAEAQAASWHRRSARGGTRGSSARPAHRLRSAAIRRGCLAVPFVDWPSGSAGPAQTLRAMLATLSQGIPAAAGGRACRVLRLFRSSKIPAEGEAAG